MKKSKLFFVVFILIIAFVSGGVCRFLCPLKEKKFAIKTSNYARAIISSTEEERVKLEAFDLLVDSKKEQCGIEATVVPGIKFVTLSKQQQKELIEKVYNICE